MVFAHPFRTSLILALAGVLLLPLRLPAQEAEAAVEITVVDAASDRPLGGAQVMVEGTGFRGVTDRDGFLRVEGVPTGARALEVRYLGYGTMRETIAINAGRLTRVLVQLEVSPIPLAEVRVEPRPSRLQLAGFHDRRRVGQGIFLTRTEIDELDPNTMSDLLRRVPGIQLTAVGGGSSEPVARMRNASCPIQFVVDGAQLLPTFNIDQVRLRDVEGVEIYRGTATVPVGFSRGNAHCGLIVIWTRFE
jgi:hypothetical protein